jgi:hypothetical protein
MDSIAMNNFTLIFVPNFKKCFAVLILKDKARIWIPPRSRLAWIGIGLALWIGIPNETNTDQKH